MDEYYEFIEANVEAQLQPFEPHAYSNSLQHRDEAFVNAYLSEIHFTGEISNSVPTSHPYCVVSNF